MQTRLPLRHYSTLLLFLLIWTAICALGVYSLASMRLKTIEREFVLQTSELGSEIEAKLITNDAVLAGFAAFLEAVDRADRASVTHYASIAKSAYPHINTLEVARHLNRADGSRFERSMRERWRDDFRLRDFPGHDRPPAGTRSERAVSWPIVFMYPELPESGQIYGIRLETVGFLSEILDNLVTSARSHASPPFHMVQGETAFILARHVPRPLLPNDAGGANFFGRPMIALLVVRAAALMPIMPTPHLQLQAWLVSEWPTRRSALFGSDLPAADEPINGILPQLTRRFEIGTLSQRVALEFHREIGLSDVFDSYTATLTLITALIFLLVSYSALRYFKTAALSQLNLERLAYAQRIAGAGLWDWNIKTGSHNWSDELFQLFGLDPGSHVGGYKTWRGVIHPDDVARATRCMTDSIRHGAPFFVQYRVVLPNGALRWIEAYGHTTYDRKGRPQNFAGMCLDITHRKQAEFALLAAKEAAETATRTKSNFLTAVSHDLRQPIAAMSLFSELIARGVAEDEQKRFAHNIWRAAQSVNDMLNLLLSVARLDSGAVEARLEDVSSAELFQWIEREFAEMFVSKGLRFKLHFPVPELRLRTDLNLLKDILRNLLWNALNHTRHGGVLVGLRRRGRTALIQVFDTGSGIAEEHIDRIFEDYYQVENKERDSGKGMGLGLAIAARKATLLGSLITCRSVPGRGTVFSLHITLG